MSKFLDYMKDSMGIYDPEVIERSRYTQEELERQARITHLQNIVQSMQGQSSQVDPALQQAAMNNQAAVNNVEDDVLGGLVAEADLEEMMATVDPQQVQQAYMPPAMPAQPPEFIQDPRFMMAMGMLASPGKAEQQIASSTMPAHLKPEAPVNMQHLTGGSDLGGDWRQKYAFDPATGQATPIEGVDPYRIGKGVTVNVGDNEPGRYLTEVEKAKLGFPADSVVFHSNKTGPKVVEQFNDSHRKAAGYGLRMVQSEQDFRELGPYVPELFDSIITEANVWDWAQGLVKTKEGKVYKSIVDDFINAMLRRESGAAISEQEYQRYYNTFFPNYNDPPEVLAQKAKKREVAISQIAGESSGLLEKYMDDYEALTGGNSLFEPDNQGDNQQAPANISAPSVDGPGEGWIWK